MEDVPLIVSKETFNIKAEDKGHFGERTNKPRCNLVLFKFFFKRSYVYLRYFKSQIFLIFQIFLWDSD